jgi:hypothetical protein
VVELSLLGRIVALRHATQLDLGFLSGELWCPDAVDADRVAARAARGAILNDIAAFGRREDAQTKARQFIIPDDVVLASRFGGVDNALAELSHGNSPVRSPSPA